MSGMTPWKDRLLTGTAKTQTGAIIACAFGERRDDVPRFEGHANVTSDGFVMCDFVDRHGDGHMGAFVGGIEQVETNLENAIKFFELKDDEAKELRAAVLKGWIAKDWRH